MTVAAEAEKPVVGTHRKPPFLRRVQIRNYKSIKFCDVTLEPLTVFVGRNGSGKSNFLDALSFFSKLMDLRLEEAVHQHAGLRAIQNRLLDTLNIFVNSNISFIVDFDFESQGERLQAHYELEIGYFERSKMFFINKESLKLINNANSEHNGSFSRTFSRDKKGYHIDGDSLQLFRSQAIDRTVLGSIGNQPLHELHGPLSGSRVYNFSSDAMRKHQLISGGPLLAEDGSNIARAIEGMREISETDVSMLCKYMNSVLPYIDEFYTVSYGDFETVQFATTTLLNGKAVSFDASSMSEGTLRFLGALVAAYQYYLPYGHPGFAAIEEPETSLHPAAMHALVEALDDATGRTQILLTTHSTELLDNPRIKPENVRVVEMIDGETVITPVDEASLEIVKQKLDTLGGLERQNQLEINQRDLNRQRKLAAEAETK